MDAMSQSTKRKPVRQLSLGFEPDFRRDQTDSRRERGTTLAKMADVERDGQSGQHGARRPKPTTDKWWLSFIPPTAAEWTEHLDELAIGKDSG